MDFLDVVNNYIDKLPKEKEDNKIMPKTKEVSEKPVYKTPVRYDLNYIVERINKGIAMQQVANEMKLDARKVRTLLKESGYRFDVLFGWWTKLNRDELLDDVSRRLAKGQLTLKQLADQRVDVNYLESIFNMRRKEIEKRQETKKQEEMLRKEELKIQAEQLEVALVRELPLDNSVFLSTEEYEVFQQMMQYWLKHTTFTRKNEMEKRSVNIELSRGNYNKLQSLSKLLGVSHEHIMNQALQQYLTRMNKELN